jgi:hypothetical protein
MISGRDLEGDSGGLFQVVSWYDETIETLCTVVDCDIFWHSTGRQCCILRHYGGGQQHKSSVDKLQFNRF